MASGRTSRGIEVALVAATCGTALVLSLVALSPAFGQTAGSSALGQGAGLRGTGSVGGLSASRIPGVTGSAVTTADPSPATPPPASYAAGAGDVSATASINYGKQRKLIKRPLPNPSLKANKRPLPQLEPYKTSYAARRRARPLDPDRPLAQPPTGVAVVPTIVEKGRKRPEDMPFEPTGISLGALRLKPYIEASGGYDSNPNRVTHPKSGSSMIRGDAGFAVQSEWSQHQLKGEMRVGYSEFPNARAASRPDGVGKIDGKIDVLRDTTIDVGGAFNISTVRPGSAELQSVGSATSTNQPIAWSAGGYLGATQKFNRLEVSLRGTLDRAQTGDATFSDGTTQKLSLNDYTTLGVRPKISYELTPGVKPFVEATVDKRVYDSVYDVNSFKRGSTGLALRAGTTVEINGSVKGEVAGGYAQRDYDDFRLVKLRGPTVDAALIWTASPLTTMTLRGSTNINETTVANASGAIARKITGEISHALLRNVTLTGGLSYQVTSYQGTNLNSSSPYTSTGLNERLLSGTVKAEYNLTRTVVVKASYAYEKLKTTVQGSDYTSNIFLLGLRLQR